MFGEISRGERCSRLESLRGGRRESTLNRTGLRGGNWIPERWFFGLEDDLDDRRGSSERAELRRSEFARDSGRSSITNLTSESSRSSGEPVIRITRRSFERIVCATHRDATTWCFESREPISLDHRASEEVPFSRESRDSTNGDDPSPVRAVRVRVRRQPFRRSSFRRTIASGTRCWFDRCVTHGTSEDLTTRSSVPDREDENSDDRVTVSARDSVKRKLYMRNRYPEYKKKQKKKTKTKTKMCAITVGKQNEIDKSFARMYFRYESSTRDDHEPKITFGTC
ncbi:uncharacterized protein LOC143147802 [Ptiloglossa arizonensis]|uniref:uncharacterized protein LOC143147802 n=1 Tax=Ptiloglossa arizonensis TaxID=3350558 RepID=UPI003FA01BB1